MKIDLRLISWLAALALASTLAQAQERVTGLRLDGDEPIEIESDKLEVREQEGVAVFTGNVEAVQGSTLLKSERMVVHYEDDGGSTQTGQGAIDRIEVEDTVYVKSDQQVATGDRGTFDMNSQVLVLSGDEVVLSEGENVIVGCKLTVQMATGQARLDGCGGEGEGRVRMLLQPGSQGQ